MADSCLSGTKEIIVKLHVNWGHAAARRLKRLVEYSVGENMGLLSFVDEVLQHSDACRALERAPHLPNAGTSQVSPFYEQIRVD